jgi:hypothetical protein
MEQFGPFPETWEALSPTGSWHLYFHWPEGGGVYNSEGRIAPGVDVRGEGGMVIAPPSIRPGFDRPYRWKNAPDYCELAHCPPGLLELVRGASFKNGTANGVHRVSAFSPVVEGSATDAERGHIVDALARASNDLDRQDWVKLCLALKTTLGSEGRQAWLDWCARWPDQRPGEPERVWDTARPDGSASIGTVLAFLEAAAPPQAPVAGRELYVSAATLPAVNYDAPTLAVLAEARPGTMPEVAHYADGVFAETIAYVAEGMRRDWPEAAFVIALQVVATAIGRNYETWTRLRSNLYTVALAESGFSKSSAIEPAKELMIQAGLQSLIGAERIKSDSGLIQSIFTHPEHKKIFFLDEYGHMLQQCTARGAGGHVRQILVEFTNLYSKANGFYAGSAYADGSRTSEMDCPHVNVFGLATPGQFWAAFGSGAIEDGTLARFSIVKPTGRPVRREPDPDKLERMRNQLAPKLAKLSLPLTQGNLGNTVTVRVQPAPEARTAWLLIGDQAEELAIEAGERMPDKDIGGILARVAETAAKVALVLAVTRNPGHPTISEADVIAGRRLAWWFAHVAIEGTMIHIADSVHQSNAQKILAFVRGGEDGRRTRRDVTRKFRNLTPRELDDVVKSLIASDLIAAETVPAGETGGRPLPVFVALKP